LTWILASLIATAVLISFFAYVLTRPPSTPSVKYPVSGPAMLALGSVAPDFVLHRLGGGPDVSLTTGKGHPTVVNFFASWCPNCAAELAAFGTLARHETGRFTVIGVDTNETSSASAEHLLADAKASYPVGVDPAAKVASAYQLSALPVTYFLNSRGRVTYVAFGSQSLATLERLVGTLLKGGRPS
jgi:peroxiredoxin